MSNYILENDTLSLSCEESPKWNRLEMKETSRDEESLGREKTKKRKKRDNFSIAWNYFESKN